MSIVGDIACLQRLAPFTWSESPKSVVVLPVFVLSCTDGTVVGLDIGFTSTWHRATGV
jgi:hypothetical protein